MNGRKNIVIIDFKQIENWEFIHALEDATAEKWEVDGTTANVYHGSALKNLVRMALYFIFPFKIFLKRKQFKNIIAWQQFLGINLAFYSRLFHVKKSYNLVVDTFIYKKKDGFIGRIYHTYMRYVVTSKYIDKFICFSQKECDYYSNLFNLPQSKFAFAPLGIETYENIISEQGEYIFSSGRSNRDFDFLIDALKDTDYTVKIACDSYSTSKQHENIHIYHNCFGSDMMSMLAKCFCVVIPLKDEHISAGQLVILQAMQMGKPVIVTQSDGITDYLLHGKNGFIIHKTKEDLLQTIDRLRNDKDLYNSVSEFSKQYFLDHHTDTALGKKFGEIINSLN